MCRQCRERCARQLKSDGYELEECNFLAARARTRYSETFSPAFPRVHKLSGDMSVSTPNDVSRIHRWEREKSPKFAAKAFPRREVKREAR